MLCAQKSVNTVRLDGQRNAAVADLGGGKGGSMEPPFPRFNTVFVIIA